MKKHNKSWIIILIFLIGVGCSNNTVRFAAIGDTPYYESDSELLVVSEALNDIHNEGLPFVVHVGDIIRGSTSCSEKLFAMRAKIFSQSPIPFLITIGDNEFNDCKDPIKARNLFRKLILNNPPLKQTVKGASPNSNSFMVTRQRGMIENVTWRYNGVDFIMLVLPDLPGVYRLKKSELNKILSFNIKFLVENFNEAKKNNSHAVVLIMHSNPVTCRLKACSKFLETLKNEIKSFSKPVLFLNGSIHEREFEGAGYMGLSNLWHLRPGSEPEESWPEIIFSKRTNLFSVKWHNAITDE